MPVRNEFTKLVEATLSQFKPEIWLTDNNAWFLYNGENKKVHWTQANVTNPTLKDVIDEEVEKLRCLK